MPTVTVSDECIAAVNRLTHKQAKAVAGALLAIATHADCPQWVRNAAEAIVLDAGRKVQKHLDA